LPKGSEGRTTKRQSDKNKYRLWRSKFFKKMQIRIFNIPVGDTGEVFEIIGAEYESVKELIDLSEKINYL